MQNITFPEFSKSLKFERLQCLVFDQPNVSYDIILGRDFLQDAKFDLVHSENVMRWNDRSVPMKPSSEPHSLFMDIDLEDDPHDMFAVEIMERKYEQVDIASVAEQQIHLTPQQRSLLHHMLSHFEPLFNGKLGKYPHRQVHLELIDGAKPVHCKPYPVARVHEQLFKQECANLVRDGVLEPIGGSEHAYPTFIVPKKDGRIRWVSDFRKLNVNLKRRQYPLPHIQNILTKRSGYQFFTKIDISMQYYTFELDEESSNLCVIITPFGKYRYRRLPMGIKISPDFAQEVMEDVLRGLDFCDVFLDDIGIFSDTFEHHVSHLSQVLSRLQDNKFTVNPLKCEWAVNETDWLGYWLTPTGLKPWHKKIDAILRLQPPQTVKQLRSFIGAINFYRDMWPRRSHFLAPLTELTGKNKFTWLPTHQTAFDNMKKIIATDALLAYPDHNKPFHVYTDASDFQLGSVIMQLGRPVAYYTRKLNSAQRNYTTIEKELLSIVETLREFRSLLLGAELHVYTDHRNLTHSDLHTQRVLRWRMLIEEFAPTFHYVPGSTNVLADFLSRSNLSEGEEVKSTFDNNSPTTEMFLLLDTSELVDCFLNVPMVNVNPIDYTQLQQHQQQQANLLLLPQQNPLEYSMQPFGQAQLVCYRPQNTHNFRIVIPDTLLQTMVQWYHNVLHHAGMDRLKQTINAAFYHPLLDRAVTQCVHVCSVCQQFKLSGRGYGELAPREALFQPWFEIAIDTIGPWTINLPGQQLSFYATTIIDTVTNLTELIRIDTPSAALSAYAFEIGWLFRYPRPVRVIHDQGNEFQGLPFQNLLRLYGILDVPTSVRNPQANAICERMHQVVGNILRTLLHIHPPQDHHVAAQAVDYALATASHALRSTIHRTLGTSPGALVFHRDMFIDLPYIADLLLLRDKRQALIDYNLRRENNKRRTHDYKINDYVLELVPNPTKLGFRTRGPFRVEQVHTNGTLTIRRSPTLIDRVNIRRLRPFFQ